MWITAPYRRVVFETLVDARANSENHCDHLTITSAERASSVRKISDGFGKSIDDNQVEIEVYLVAAFLFTCQANYG